MTKPHGSISIEIGIAYLHGRLEAQIEAFADSIGLSASELTYRVGDLLCTKARGTLLGPEHHLPDMRRAPAEPYSPSRALALAGSSHGQTARSGESPVDHAAGLNKSGNLRGMNQATKTSTPQSKATGSSDYWNNMTSEERDAEMLIRMENRTNLRPQDKALLKRLRAKVSSKALAARRAARSKTKANGKEKPKAKSHDASKQQVYRERHQAKINGLPIPPLPAS